MSEPAVETVTVKGALASNVRDHRVLLRLTQEQLASRMGHLGHDWTQATVSEVERKIRALQVDEVLGLAMALDSSVVELLDAGGVRRVDRHLDVGGGVLLADWAVRMLVTTRPIPFAPSSLTGPVPTSDTQ